MRLTGEREREEVRTGGTVTIKSTNHVSAALRIPTQFSGGISYCSQMTDSKQQDNLVGVTERFIGRRIVHTELRTSHIPAKDSLMQGVMACYRTELCFW